MSAPFDKTDYRPTDTFAFEVITATSSALPFTDGTWNPSGGSQAVAAHVIVEGGGVRWRADGTAPTASVGTLLNDGDGLTVWGTMDIQSMSFIAVAGDVSLNVHYAR